MIALWRDVRLAIRQFRRSPIVAATAGLTLAIGVAANVAVFSVVNGFIVRPLPVRDADRLVVLATRARSDQTLRGVSYADLEDYRAAAADVFEDIAAYSVGFLGLGVAGERPARVLVTWISESYFPLLDLQPARGRLLGGGDAGAGSPNPIVVLGYTTWQRRFHSDPAVVGQVVRVNGLPSTIVGVAPPGFHGAFAFSDAELYLPLNWLGTGVFEDRGARGLHALARLRPNVSLARAQAAMDVVAGNLRRDHPFSNEDVDVRVLPERLARPEEDQARSNARGAALVLTLVGLVMALAGANVASLLLARNTERRHEFAIRTALGAGRGRLMRQLLVEGLLLAAVGAAAGLLAGSWTAHTLARVVRLPGDLPVRFDFGLDWRVALYACGVAMGTGLAVSIFTSVRGLSNMQSRLGPSSRGTLAGAASHRTRSAVVAVQLATCFVILGTAGLLLRSLWAAERADLGFNPDGVLNVHVDVGQLGYSQAEGRALFADLERRVQAVPTVESVSFAFTIPMGYIRDTDTVEAEGAPAGVGPLFASTNLVSPGYFETMGIGIVRGRGFEESDDERSPRVAVVNRRFAEVFWPGEDAIGRRFRPAAGGEWIQIVGVTDTGKYRFLFEDPLPYFYVPIGQEYVGLRVLQVRSEVPPETLAPVIERLILDRAPDLPLYDVQSMAAALGSGPGLFLVRAGAAAAATFGVLGLVLAVVGVYGLVAHATVQRTREIGVRIALGATGRDVLALVLGVGVRSLAAGISAGLAIVIAGAGALQRFLFGVSSRDVATLTAVALTLAVVTILACVAPAWRALRTNPAVALRTE